MDHTHTRLEARVALTTLALLLSLPACGFAQENENLFKKILGESLRAIGQSQAQEAPEPQGPEDRGLPEESGRPELSEPDTPASSSPRYNYNQVQNVTLVVGQTTTIRLPEWIKRVITDRTLVEARVNPNELHELVITAQDTPGAVEVTVVDRAGNTHRFQVTITQDTSGLRNILTKRFPYSNIEVIPVIDQSVMIFGQVENPGDVAMIMNIASKFYADPINSLEVVGPQMVQLKVMIAEVSRTKLRAMGFNFLVADDDNGTIRYLTNTVGDLVTLTRSTTGLTGLDFAFNSNSNVLVGKLELDHEFRGFLRALKQEGLAEILVQPTLTTFSGRAASMVIGGEVPIPIPSGDNVGSVGFEFRQFGKRLDFVPTVLGGGRVRLEVRPEVSEVDFSIGVVSSGFTIPGFRQRQVDTSVELYSGETFVIGGLLSTSDTANTNKVPFLGDLPFIGTAFRTTSYDREELELIIMVTPELVEAMKPEQKPLSYPGGEGVPPGNHELFFWGNVESPAGERYGISGLGNATSTHSGGQSTQEPSEQPAADPVVLSRRSGSSRSPVLLGPRGYASGH